MQPRLLYKQSYFDIFNSSMKSQHMCTVKANLTLGLRKQFKLREVLLSGSKLPTR